MTVESIKNNTERKKEQKGNNGHKTYRKVLEYTISNTSDEHSLHRFTKRVIITRLILN